MNNENYEDPQGLVFNIQRFSVHDGPGIRTTVFLKGCPLRCRWCSNPESWNPFPEIMAHDARCAKCGQCAKVCPIGAISFDPRLGREIDWTKCDRCFRCADICPNGAITRLGRYMSVSEVLAEVEKDEPFYHNSGGGVTLSGGEPLAQAHFAFHLLKACRKRAFHTALETCGYAAWEVLERLLPYVDLVLYDLKHTDPLRHEEGTGKSNLLILDNAQRIAAKARVWLRAPLIPGYNDSMENLRELGKFAARIGVEKISLLPYHRWGETKYEKLGRKYPLGQSEPPSEERLQEIERLLESWGTKVTIGN